MDSHTVVPIQQQHSLVFQRMDHMVLVPEQLDVHVFRMATIFQLKLVVLVVAVVPNVQ